MEKITVFWHRRDLRCQDNAGLYYALNDELPTLPIFILDTNILDDLENDCDPRVHFMHDRVRKLDQTYRKNGSGLWVYYGKPEDAFKELLSSFDIRAVYTNRDYEPYAKKRDVFVEQFLKSHNIGFYTFKDQVIFEAEEITTGQGNPYKVFTPYKNAWISRYKLQGPQTFKSEFHLKALHQWGPPAIPGLSMIGFKASKVPIPDQELSDEMLKKYGTKRDYPALEATSRVGVHLRFGTLSIRYAVKEGFEKSPEWLNELIWREFYMMILSCFPQVVDRSFKAKYDRIKWENDDQMFKRWCEGTTGYPIVDAGMRELNETGYMHNRVRMIVASFLTKHLLIDWRWGERYFAARLLDYELASNNGGWQWAAGSGTDAQPYFRVFNPYIQQKKFDKDWEYVKRWVPEYGTDAYPAPVVIHENARKKAIDIYKEALS